MDVLNDVQDRHAWCMVGLMEHVFLLWDFGSLVDVFATEESALEVAEQIRATVESHRGLDDARSRAEARVTVQKVGLRK